MSAYDQSSNKGSFRGAPFLVTEDDLDFGRRVIVHGYPLRDDPGLEDTGGLPDQFAIRITVIGAEFEQHRDELIKQIRKPGSGELKHPNFGTMKVSIIKARVRHKAREEGKATFTLTCVAGDGLPEPRAYKETVTPVKKSAAAVIEVSETEFADEFSVLQQAADFVDEVQAEVDSVLAVVEEAVSGVIDPLAALIRTPANLAASITGSINRISATLNDPLRALSLYEGLFNAGSSSPSIPTTTANRQQQVNNVDALHNLVRRAAVAEAARVSLDIEFVASDDALAVRDRILNAIDGQMETASNDIYQAMADLRVAVAEDLRIRGARLPEITYYTPRAVLPALVLAYQIHGDANREDEIISRNKITHPGFVAGGEPLEVLTNV